MCAYLNDVLGDAHRYTLLIMYRRTGPGRDEHRGARTRIANVVGSSTASGTRFLSSGLDLGRGRGTRKTQKDPGHGHPGSTRAVPSGGGWLRDHALQAWIVRFSTATVDSPVAPDAALQDEGRGARITAEPLREGCDVGATTSQSARGRSNPCLCCIPETQSRIAPPAPSGARGKGAESSSFSPGPRKFEQRAAQASPVDPLTGAGGRERGPPSVVNDSAASIFPSRIVRCITQSCSNSRPVARAVPLFLPLHDDPVPAGEISRTSKGRTSTAPPISGEEARYFSRGESRVRLQRDLRRGPARVHR